MKSERFFCFFFLKKFGLSGDVKQLVTVTLLCTCIVVYNSCIWTVLLYINVDQHYVSKVVKGETLKMLKKNKLLLFAKISN